MRADSPSVLPFASASDELLSAVLDQSPDCVKLLSVEGCIDYMNRAGQCAMEIDDFGSVAGVQWPSLWPADIRPVVLEAVATARDRGEAQFSAFCPTAKGKPKWWDVSVKALTLNGSIRGFIAVSRDITPRVEAQQASESIAAEMRHRLSNAYLVAGGLMQALARGVPERELFAGEMIGRLAALGAAQTLQHRDEGLSLAPLVNALVTPYATPDCSIHVTDLPNQTLERRQLEALAMVFGELAVNSTKHGALSTRGRVTITGERSDDAALTLCWSEQSGRPVGARERSGGNGMRLMKRILGSCGGDIEISWRSDGLDATIRLEGAVVA